MPRTAAVSSRSRIVYQVAAVAVLAAVAAGCSSTRFNNSVVTGATEGATTQTAHNQPMPPALVGNNPIANGQPNTVTTAALPPATGAPIDYTPQVAVQPAALTPGPVAQTPQSSAITVAAGDTLYSLSRAYGVSVAAIAGTNGLTQTSTLTIGQRLVIPAPGTTAALGNAPAPLGVVPGGGVANATPPAAAPVVNQSAQPGPQTANAGVHVVQTGETIYSIALRYGVSPATLAQANSMASPDIVQVGQQLTIPGSTATNIVAANNAAPPDAPAAAPPTQQPANPQIAAAETPPANAVVTDAPPAQVAALPAETVSADPQSIDGTSFRWPVNGNSRVISDFGAKPGGERNDGINLSVPMGTEVHAAEAGTVIYAGNGIAGYGNLILIEHANNWVTAYAHTSEIRVQRDDIIQRGQVIAAAGNTGSVTAPQLHFELRRGTVPVNPLDYLSN